MGKQEKLSNEKSWWDSSTPSAFRYRTTGDTEAPKLVWEGAWNIP